MKTQFIFGERRPKPKLSKKEKIIAKEIRERGGLQIVAQCIIDKKVYKESLKHGFYNYPPIEFEIDQLKKYAYRLWPEAIDRVGCICCYGDGPNITIRLETNKNKQKVLNCYIDFDFKIEEDK